MHRFCVIVSKEKTPEEGFWSKGWGEERGGVLEESTCQGNSELIIVEFAMSCYNARKTLSLIFQVNIFF